MTPTRTSPSKPSTNGNQPDRHIPAMAQKARHTVRKAGQRADLSEIGTYGLRQYGGYVIEEWLRALSGPRRAWAFREMADNDPVVGAIMYSIRMLSRGVTWPVTGEDQAAVEFVEECMCDMSHTWGDFVSELLSMLTYGWSFHEIVYKRRNGPQGSNSQTASSEFTDGKIGWRKLPVRAQETLMRWEFDEQDDGLMGLHQLDYHGRSSFVPIEKALLFRTRSSRNNPEGTSVLRNAYVSWFRLKNIQEIEAIGVERDLAGIPKIKPTEPIDIYSKANAELLGRLEELVQTIRRDEDEGIVLPYGWELELLTTGGSRQIDTDQIVRRYEQRIASSMLADFILIGQDAVGSFAMVDIKADLFGQALDSILDIACEVVNRYAIPRLLALNGMDTSDPPHIGHASTGRVNVQFVGQFLNQLSLAGAPIPWTQELIEQMFKAAGLPVDFDAPAAPELKPAEGEPGSVPAPPAPNRGTPNLPAAPVANDSAATQAPADPLAKADVQTGVMVALYPSTAVARQLAQPGGEKSGDLHVTLAFLGDAASLGEEARLRKVVSGFAASCPPLQGKVSGTGKFTAGAEPVSYASVDLPDLPHARQQLVDVLTRAGFPPSTDHGYTPHLTLAYDDISPDVANHDLNFDHVSLVIAGRKFSYPLAGQKFTKAERAMAALTKNQTADREPTRLGTVVKVSPFLRSRAKVLQSAYEADVRHALGQLGQSAQRAYLTTVTKADRATSAGAAAGIVAKIMARLDTAGWFQNVLRPVIQAHSQRVLNDTLETLRQHIGLEVNIPDPVARQIIASGGSQLGLADLEAQVREALMSVIAEGRAAGRGPLEIARAIEQLVPAGPFVNAGSKYRAQLISRQETLNAQLESAKAAYRNAEFVTGVQISDGILEDSDAECQSRDGIVVPIGQMDSIQQNHPLCTLSLDVVIGTPTELGMDSADTMLAVA